MNPSEPTKPAALQVPPAATAEWHLQPRGQSGVFIASTRGTLLCRYDDQARMIYFWDKKGTCEVPIALDDLLRLREILNVVV